MWWLMAKICVLKLTIYSPQSICGNLRKNENNILVISAITTVILGVVSITFLLLPNFFQGS